MSLCLKLEQALAAYLRGIAELMLPGPGTYLKTDAGVKVTIPSGYSFELAIVTGAGKRDPLEAPFVVAGCSELTEGEGLYGTRVFKGNLTVNLFMSAEDWSVVPDVMAAYEWAAQTLAAALYVRDLAARLTHRVQGGATVISVTAERTEAHQTLANVRQYTFTIPVVATYGDVGVANPS